jgi:hypothetical protein
MNIKVTIEGGLRGRLTTDSAMSSYGVPVLEVFEGDGLGSHDGVVAAIWSPDSAITDAYDPAITYPAHTLRMLRAEHAPLNPPAASPADLLERDNPEDDQLQAIFQDLCRAFQQVRKES